MDDQNSAIFLTNSKVLNAEKQHMAKIQTSLYHIKTQTSKLRDCLYLEIFFAECLRELTQHGAWSCKKTSGKSQDTYKEKAQRIL